jgi:hypothetical protein
LRATLSFVARRSALLVVIGTLVVATSAHAQVARTPPSPDAPRVAFAAAIMVGLGLALAAGDVDPARTWGGNPVDDAIRDGLRLSDVGARTAIGRASDVMVGGLLAYGGIVDGLAVPLLQGDPELAWQGTAAYALAIGVTLTLDSLVKYVAARERPVERCAASAAADCGTPSSGASFYSGHSAISFASAGASCAIHLERGLYGDAVADGAACGVSLLAATTVGVFRILADQHYFTDVLVGAAVGFVAGYLIPMWLVPRRVTVPSTPSASVMVLPTASLGAAGLETVGLNALGAF